jgi:serine/threonine protein kinase/DNA-binding SARP family transcriptional activator
MSSSPSADRNLIFGLLALQMDFVTREQLLDAMAVWMLDKQTPLGDILCRRGMLAEDERQVLDLALEKHLRRHGGDPQASLAAIRVEASVRQDLDRLDDADVKASVASVSPVSPASSGPGTKQGASDDSLPIPETAASLSTSATTLRFRRLREHARGGLGEVFVALDEELQREVALKQIQDRFADQSAARGRFVREAEITGKLEHPGIVPVYGLGVYPDGRPFYAMRFIRGESMHDAIRRFHAPQAQGLQPLGFDSLAFRDLLNRFVSVCHAVAYAHARGAIHRDLKPANVMLGEYGETLVVDWGLARLLDAPQGEQTTAEQRISTGSGSGTAPTEMGQVVGTPAYIPPEQAEGRLDRVGVASDVFALGATLYALLTGHAPYEGDDVLGQARRAEALPARWRKRSVPAALEAVCGKAMAKRPEERYGSARAVAEEVQRFLADEPVRAHREPLPERLRRWRKRHRTLVAASAMGLLTATVALAVGLVVVNAEKEEKRKALVAEEAAKKDAERRLAQIEKGVELFAGMLSGIDPRAEEKRDPPLYDQLRARAEKAADQLQAEAVGDPLAMARLQTIMGNTLCGLGSYERAVEILQRARAARQQELGADHSDTLVTLNYLARAHQQAGKLPEAIALYEQVRDVRMKKLGADHPDTLATLNNLAGAYQANGKLPEAIALLQLVRDVRVKELEPDHPSTLTTLNNLALAYQYSGKLAEAIDLYREVRDARVKKLGADHPDTLGTANNLAGAYHATGKLSDAIALYHQVRDARLKKLGANHPDTLLTLHNLAGAYRAAGKLPEAIALYEQVRDTRKKKLGADHPDTLATLNNLAGAYEATGKLPEAIQLLEQVRNPLVKKLGADHPATLTTLNNLAGAYQATGKLPEAIALYHQVHDARLKKLGANHPATLNTLNNLAVAYRGAGKLPAALPLFDQAATGFRKRRFLDRIAMRTIDNTIAAYEAAKMWDKAESWRRVWIEHVKEKAGSKSFGYAVGLSGLGLDLLPQREWTEAERVLSEALNLLQMQAPEVWTTFNTMSLLGGALAGQNKHVEAEPLLLKGYQGMKVRVKTIPPRSKICLSEAAERLVELYRAMKKDDAARKWQQTLTNIVGKLQEPIHDVGKGLTLKNHLDTTTKTLAYQVRLQAGTQYVIAMSSADGKALAPSLALTDEENNVLAESGQSGGDARVIYRALRTSVYRIRATSANDDQGAFTLTVARKKEEK